MSSSVPAGPAGPAGPALWLLFLAMCRASYETANIVRPPPATTTEVRPPVEPPSAAEQEWARKAVQRYAQAQQREWRRWREAMFEADRTASAEGSGPKLKRS